MDIDFSKLNWGTKNERKVFTVWLTAAFIVGFNAEAILPYLPTHLLDYFPGTYRLAESLCHPVSAKTVGTFMWLTFALAVLCFYLFGDHRSYSSLTFNKKLVNFGFFAILFIFYVTEPGMITEFLHEKNCESDRFYNSRAGGILLISSGLIALAQGFSIVFVWIFDR